MPKFDDPEFKRAYQREWARTHRENVNRYNREAYERRGAKIRADIRAYKKRDRATAKAEGLFPVSFWSNKRWAAKKKGLEFSIERKDYPIPDMCPAFGIPLDSRDTNHRPSLDRIDNSIGYIPGNVVVVSMKANTAKRDLTIDQLRQLANFYEKL